MVGILYPVKTALTPGRLSALEVSMFFYLRMRMGTVENLPMKHPRNLQVVNIDRLTRNLFLCIHLWDSLPNVDKLFMITPALLLPAGCFDGLNNLNVTRTAT